MKIIAGNLTKENKLWQVFWIQYVLLSCVISLIYEPIVDNSPKYIGYFFLGLTALWLVWVFVGLWRCAFNVKRRFWGLLTRGFVIFTVLGIGIQVLVNFLALTASNDSAIESNVKLCYFMNDDALLISNELKKQSIVYDFNEIEKCIYGKKILSERKEEIELLAFGAFPPAGLSTTYRDNN